VPCAVLIGGLTNLGEWIGGRLFHRRAYSRLG
jgi:hypothetical protein